MKPLIFMKNIEKVDQLDGQAVRTLDNVSLTIHPGEFVAIIGLSGTGQSAMRNILSCFDKPDRGDYHLDGFEVSALDEEQLAVIRNQKVGLVFKQPFVGASISEQAGLSSIQQQRGSVAMTLINKPLILLVDEPTGEHDNKANVELLKLFQTLNMMGKTVVLVTHRPEVAQYAKRVVRFRNGKIVSDEEAVGSLIAI